MRAWLESEPLVIARAEGNVLVGEDGRRYIDGAASLWVNVHGHNHAHINSALRSQIDLIAHSTLLGLASPPSILLAERLVQLAPPGLKRVFFSDSGSTAVEVALKISFQYQQLCGFSRRKRFLVLDQSYHGDTIGSVSLGAIDTFHQIFHPLLFSTVRSPADTDEFERIFLAHKDDLAAVVMEPLVQGAAGIRLMPPGLLARAAELCRAHGVLLIADEVATGFGRTGTLFASTQENVTPDLLCVAKGLSGGYLPVAATLTTQAVFDRFLGAPNERVTFFHGHSFGGNPLGCAAALASLELFERERTIEQLPAKIERFRAGLARLIAPLPSVSAIRQRGLMIGVELRARPEQPFPPALAIGARVCARVRAHGVILRPLGDVVVIMPPLSITPDEIDTIITATAAAISETLPSGVPIEVNAPAAPTAAPTNPPLRGLFVAGTDTGVGKTALSRALLRLAHARGLRVTPAKPVESGCLPDPSQSGPHAPLIPLDARALAQAAHSDLPLDAICPFALRAPLAPSLAARREGRTVTVSALVDACRALHARANAHGAPATLLVESAGGLLSPIEPAVSNADLAAQLGLPVLLVARNALGTINHTALAIAELRRRALPLAGVVLCQVQPMSADASDDGFADHARAIHELTGVAPLGLLPFCPDAATPGDAGHDALAAALAIQAGASVLLGHLTAPAATPQR